MMLGLSESSNSSTRKEDAVNIVPGLTLIDFVLFPPISAFRIGISL